MVITGRLIYIEFGNEIWSGDLSTDMVCHWGTLSSWVSLAEVEEEDEEEDEEVEDEDNDNKDDKENMMKKRRGRRKRRGKKKPTPF